MRQPRFTVGRPIFIPVLVSKTEIFVSLFAQLDVIVSLLSQMARVFINFLKPILLPRLEMKRGGSGSSNPGRMANHLLRTAIYLSESIPTRSSICAFPMMIPS